MLRVKVFLDTNILIDMLSSQRRPFSDASDRIFQAIRDGRLEGVISIQSIVDASYILQRDNGSLQLFREKILQIQNYVNLEPLDYSDLHEALLSSQSDFEDELQYSHAYGIGCDYFITADRKLQNTHKNTGMQICTPEEFIQIMTETPSPESTERLSPQRGR